MFLPFGQLSSYDRERQAYENATGRQPNIGMPPASAPNLGVPDPPVNPFEPGWNPLKDLGIEQTTGLGEDRKQGGWVEDTQSFLYGSEAVKTCSELRGFDRIGCLLGNAGKNAAKSNLETAFSWLAGPLKNAGIILVGIVLLAGAIFLMMKGQSE